MTWETVYDDNGEPCGIAHSIPLVDATPLDGAPAPETVETGRLLVAQRSGLLVAPTLEAALAAHYDSDAEAARVARDARDAMRR